MKSLLTGLLLCLLPAAALADQHTHHDHSQHPPMQAQAVEHDHSLFHLDATWQSQHGKDFALPQLAGKPTLITMIYGSCTTACPVLVNDARRIESALDPAEREQLQVVVVSFDPARDTPERMSDYAGDYGVDGQRWHFLHGDPAEIRTLAAMLGVRYRDNGDGSFDHSNLISLLDASGQEVHRSEGLARPVEPMVEALRQTLTLRSGDSGLAER